MRLVHLTRTEKSVQQNWVGRSDAVEGGGVSTIRSVMVVPKNPMVLCEKG